MKYKKLIKNLKLAQKYWESLPDRIKSATMRPGSVKQRVITGNNGN